MMANAFDSYLRAKQGAMQEGQNALSMQQTVDKIQKDRQLREILSGAYQQPQAAVPAMGETPAIPAQAGGMNMPNALNAMYQGGFGPEAMAIQQKQSQMQGATPSAVNTYKFWKSLPQNEQTDMLNTMRQNYSVEDLAGSKSLVSKIPGQAVTTISPAQKEFEAAAEKERSKKLGADAATASGKAVEQVVKIRQNIANLDEVIRLVGDGAETGPLAKSLPSFRAASVELDNMRNRLGLDVIGAVTFGALSKGELDLALDTALPTKLDGPELVNWAKGKKAAQEKLADYFQNQASYLAQPGGTAAGWLEAQKGRSNQSVNGGAQGIKQGTIKNIGGKTYINMNGKWFQQ